MIRRPPRSTLDRSSAASDVYKRQIQITFLDAAGVAHENGVMREDLEIPYAEESAVARAAAAVREKHGDDGERYLRTLARYSPAAWPGIDRIAGDAIGE